MKICLVSYEFPPDIIGGAGTYAGMLHHGLLDEGIEVSVVTQGNNYKHGNIFRLKTPNIQYWRRLFFSYYAGEFIKKRFTNETFDLIHYNEPHIIISKPDIPSLSTFHSTQVNELITKLRLSNLVSTKTVLEAMIKSPVGSIGDVISCRRSDRIICPNNHLKQMIKKYCLFDERMITVINNGVFIEDYGGENDAEYKLGNFDIKEDKYLLCVGRLDPIKGIEYLIQSFKKVKKDHKIKLVIVGTGFHEAYLKKMADEDIIFTGHVADRKTLSMLYRYSSMVVMPSLYEALPMVLLEAMAFGKPVVASRVGGIPEVVIQGINGYLVEPKCVEELNDKIRYLLDNEDVSKKISSNNLKVVRENFSLKTMVNKTIEVYESLIKDYGH